MCLLKSVGFTVYRVWAFALQPLSIRGSYVHKRTTISCCFNYRVVCYVCRGCGDTLAFAAKRNARDARACLSHAGALIGRLAACVRAFDPDTRARPGLCRKPTRPEPRPLHELWPVISLSR